MTRQPTVSSYLTLAPSLSRSLSLFKMLDRSLLMICDFGALTAKFASLCMFLNLTITRFSCWPGSFATTQKAKKRTNVEVEILFEKELIDITLKAEESLIKAGIEFKGQCNFAARKLKPVTRNPLKKHISEWHCTQRCKHSQSEKQISYLRKLFVHMTLKNKKEECYNILFSDYANDSITQQHVRSLGTHSR